MYRDLREVYLWDGLKKYIVNFESKCPNRKQVNAENLKPSSIIQEMSFPTLKWKILIWTLLLGCLEPGGRMIQSGI